MLARFSLGEDDAARRIERAVADALAAGPRTADLDDTAPASTDAFTTAVIGALPQPALTETAVRA
jgi:isocitrate/isopropylmalate dehydrogenase